MARIKRAVAAKKKRRTVMHRAKGYYGAASRTYKHAKEQVQHSLQPATKDRLNPFTHSNYATLNSVMDSCREALLINVVWFQYPVPAESGR